MGLLLLLMSSIFLAIYLFPKYLNIFCASIIESSPFTLSYDGILSRPATLPFFNDFISTTTSSLRIPFLILTSFSSYSHYILITDYIKSYIITDFFTLTSLIYFTRYYLCCKNLFSINLKYILLH